MFSLWRKARRENSAASRLLGSTSLRFALHGWQRKMMRCNQGRITNECRCRDAKPLRAGTVSYGSASGIQLGHL
ncbi:hypothetical protein, partial [Thiolapillus sp.]|uniref:hypothetical protein n=1 Tax=Thiolapillus sp. TaxID=2017437 RepID=UPI003AF81312